VFQNMHMNHESPSHIQQMTILALSNDILL
jgi:hypothetical protein